jgi:hypothetical protein
MGTGRCVRGGGPVALGLILLLLSGCGGKSSGTSSSPQTTSTQTSSAPAAAFSPGYAAATTQLEHISKAIGANIQQAPGSSNAQLASAFGDLASRWQTQLSQLETLTPPPNLAAEYNTFKDSVGRVEPDLRGIVSAAQTGNKAAAEQATASLISDIAGARAADAPIRQTLGIK